MADGAVTITAAATTIGTAIEIATRTDAEIAADVVNAMSVGINLEAGSEDLAVVEVAVVATGRMPHPASLWS